MKLTKVTLATLILLGLMVVACGLVTIYGINIEPKGSNNLILLAPIVAVFLYQGLEISKTSFQVGNFTIKLDSLKICSISLAIAVGCMLIANICNLIFDEVYLYPNGVLLAAAVVSICITFISYLQTSLSIKEIMSVTIDKVLFFLFIFIAILNITFHYYIPEQYEYFSFLMLFIFLPSLLLFLRSLRNKTSFLPNFLMSMSFLVFLVLGILEKYVKLGSFVQIAAAALSISLVIIAIDQAKEIAKSLEPKPELSLDIQSVTVQEEK